VVKIKKYPEKRYCGKWPWITPLFFVGLKILDTSETKIPHGVNAGF
jgi:hypothetical protein